MRSLTILIFFILALSRVSFAKEMVGFCVGAPELPGNCFTVDKSVLENFPQSTLSQVISGEISTEILRWDRDEISGKIVPYYKLYNYFDRKLFEKILNWMEKGDTSIFMRWPLTKTEEELFFVHIERLQLPELEEALKRPVGQFVKIPSGKYEIGNLAANDPYAKKDERRHWVTLSEFEIGETAVTQENYVIRTGKKNPSKHKEKHHCPNHFKGFEVKDGITSACVGYPVENVSWDEAKKYTRIVSKNDPKYTYQLPTEAQQEVAFRGKTTTIYVSGDAVTGMNDFAWYWMNSWGKTHLMKSNEHRPNEYGVYRSGVWEWGRDYYKSNYEYEGADGLDPSGPSTGSDRVLRGGSWLCSAQDCRSAYRNYGDPSYPPVNGDFGFRLVRTPRNSQLK
jgi:formylglycine-generating enzyme required for sulfatase activity